MKVFSYRAPLVRYVLVSGIAIATIALAPLTAFSNMQNLWTEAKLDGGVYYFQRNRQRVDNNFDYQANLSHATTQVALNFNSGYAGGILGFDFGGFGAYDLSVDETGPLNQEHEFAFAGDKWGENYRSGAPEGGVSLSRAALKLQFFKEKLKFSGGLTQLSVPGVIGVNWSYLPGTYRGAQMDLNLGSISLTYAWADQYKAPWFKRVQNFSRLNAWNQGKFSGDNAIDYIHGFGGRCSLPKGFGLQFGWGQSQGYMDAYHIKLSQSVSLGDGLDWSYQFYGATTKDDVPVAHSYDGLAWQQAVTSSMKSGSYTFRIEFMMTRAEGGLGCYIPRLTRGYGNSQGGLEIWWDSRSDWNHDNEKTIFAGINRSLDDIKGMDGWSVGISCAYGWDAVAWQADGHTNPNIDKGRESALNFDIAYTIPDGRMKGTLFKLHFTDYHNYQDELGSWAYPNMFTSEHDVKFHVIAPFSIL